MPGLPHWSYLHLVYFHVLIYYCSDVLGLSSLLSHAIALQYEGNTRKNCSSFSLCLVDLHHYSNSSLFGLGSIIFVHAFAICTPDFSADSNYYLGILLLAALVPLLVAIVCNMWVIRIVFKNIKAIYKVRRSLLTMQQRWSHSLSLENILRKKRQKKQLNLMRVFGSLLCASLMAWIPVMIVAIVSFIGHFDDIPPEFNILSYFLLFSQVIIHPSLETAFLSPVKDPIKKIFRRFCLPFKCLANCSCNGDFSVDTENDKPSFCGRCDALYVLYAALIPKDMNSDIGTGVLE